MGVLSDWQIQRDVGIEPFAPNERREGKISYGLSSYGYDARLGYRFGIIKPYPEAVIDPKNFRDDMLEHIVKQEGEYLDLPAHSFILGESLETFTIPRDVLCIVTGKSTYARCGLYVNVTPGEPEWSGKWTIELSNTTPKPVRIYPGEGIMQCVFLRTDGYAEIDRNEIHNILRSSTGFDPKFADAVYRDSGTCQVSYKDKKGRYQSQMGITLPSAEQPSAPESS